MYTVGN